MLLLIRDIVRARELLKDLPDADYLLADKGYNTDWFREELKQHRVEPCIPLLCATAGSSYPMS
ncbi:MAG: hypothetical protein LBK24_02315 [Puniceicoccales bacterium]|jgi:IS5 family transposase|nr:hypothetical protein [Puniceicoccales bacterium]